MAKAKTAMDNLTNALTKVDSDIAAASKVMKANEGNKNSTAYKNAKKKFDDGNTEKTKK